MKKLLISFFALSIFSLMPVSAQECTAVRASHILVKTESDAKLMRKYVEKYPSKMLPQAFLNAHQNAMAEIWVISDEEKWLKSLKMWHFLWIKEKFPNLYKHNLAGTL